MKIRLLLVDDHAVVRSGLRMLLEGEEDVQIVGETGTVYPEEIDEGKVKGLEKSAAEKKLPQVRPILGKGDNPCLPEKSVDAIYVRHVYHHFAQPRPMLRGMWRGLKPGGHLVVVDRRLGTLQDWVPRE